MLAIVPRTLSTSEAATYIGCERKKLLRLLHAKRIKAKDLDGRLRFTMESLDKFLNGLPDALDTEREVPCQ
jgi:excisionase family DNA binding protein